MAGQNVNMVGGPWSFDPATGRILGDPFLQRQNEPSMALSSRNGCHILAGANDYRTVDVPGLPGDTETGDAWLGVFKSIDCGQTWTSTLLPGYPQDLSAEGVASPLKGLKAGADATVRPGPAGMLYYSGIGFDRGSKNLGKVFVSRFIDRNDKEQGDPIRYLGTAQIETGTAGQFLDKPWIAADMPRSGATCSVDGQTVPAGNVYIAYTSFTGGSNNPRSKIMFSRSTDCGATWSNAAKLSERIALNQGTVLAVSPVDGSIYIAWREFTNPSDPAAVHAILFVRSTDGGKSFTKAAPIDTALRPFDQGTSSGSFRSNAYPTMAVDGTGRIYVAWAARGFGSFRPDPVTGDARIVMAVSSDGGASWSMPRAVVDNYPGPGHQLMPALTFAAGKLVLAYYDFREDESLVYGQYVDEFQAASVAPYKRHTVDLRSAMAEPAAAPVFSDYTTVNGDGSPRTPTPSTQVSQYLFGSFGGTRPGLVQVQFNPPNLPIFAQGTVPFIGDYIDVAGPVFTLDANRQWQFNTAADGARIPLFHVAWTDNRDVRKPPPGQTWASYKSPTLGPNSTICDAGSNPGSRNQNVYTATLMPGLVVTAPGNHKTLGAIQRAFVVFAKNTTGQDRSYVLTLAAPPAGAFASFTHIDETQLAGGQNPAVTLQIGPILVPRRSSIARSVFIVSPGQQYPPVTVNVVEVNPPAGQAAASAVAVLNPDIANPDIANPDIANPDIANPDIANAEVYNPDIANPDIANPDIANPDIANPDIANPDIANPDIANPDIANPDIANPDIANPDIANPDIANPDIANPDIANSALSSYKVTDVTWPVTNKGNTTAAYAFRAKLKRGLPEGAQYQLIVRRVYIAPQANLLNSCGPLLPVLQNQVLVNIPSPDLTQSITGDFDPNEYRDNASFFLQPADRGLVTLRVFCPASASGCPTNTQLASLVAARVISQAPNNCPAGVTNGNCAVDDYNPDDIYDPADVVAPVVSAPASFTVEAAGPAGAPVSFSASAQDDISGPLPATCVPASGTAFPLGATTVTCSATDGDGNVGTASFTVTVADTTAPVLTVPANISGVQASVSGGASVSYSVTAADLVSGPVAPVCSPVSGSTFPLGTSPVSCTATDAAGNTAAASFTVTVVDTVAPVVNGFSFPPGFTPGQWYGASSITATVNVTDGSNVTVQCSDSLGAAATTVNGLTITISGDGIHLVSCTVTDQGGNSTTSSPTTVQLDGTVPSVTVPSVLVTAEATSAAGAAVGYTFSASDATSGATVSCVPPSGSTFPVGDTPVSCTATDGAGNTASVNFTVRVADSTPPAITLNGSASVTLDAGSAFVDAGALASDLVDGAVTVTVEGSVNTAVPGVYTLTYVATDAAGNTARVTVQVTVVDSVAPAVTVPAPIVAEATSAAGAAVTFTATALDAISGPATATCAPASGSVFALGATTVSCSAQDGSGNTGTATFTVTVRDTTSPSVTPPAPVVAEATSAAGAVVTYGTASATDAVTANPPAVCTPARGTTFPLGVTTVVCSATDAAGNTGSASATVTVRDTTAPAVIVPAPITAEATGPLGAPVTFSASATDTVAGSVATSCAPASGSTFPLGTTTVSCTATDGRGNTGAASFTVSVRDTTAPALTLPAPITKPATSLSGAAVSYTATATDKVDGSVTPVCTPASGTVFAIGTTTVNCSATDRAGNRSTGSFTVTVQLQYGFVNVKNLPPPSGTRFNLGSSVPLSWQWTLGGQALDTADARPLITITGPSGSATFTPESPGNSTFQYSTTTFVWQFNWQTKNLVAGSYTVTVTCRKTGQTFSGGVLQLK